MLDIAKTSRCCGCCACADICPVNCIKMVQDMEGFDYPAINQEACVRCGLCEAVCPILNKSEMASGRQAAYACWHRDVTIRLNSTSGGAFSALANTILRHGGYVIAARYTDDFTVKHIQIKKAEKISTLRQSKYVQSHMTGAFSEVKNALSTGADVLFCGTPCHNAALLNFLGERRSNLTLCDFICRGVISERVYTKYLNYLSEKYRSPVTRVHFKNKQYGWNRFSTCISFENGKQFIADRYHDPYMLLYLRENLSLRPSCYACQFKGIERHSDITLGDFWGVSNFHKDYDNDQGTSAVIVHTEKGDRLIEEAATEMEVHEAEIAEIIPGNACIMESPACPRERSKFFAQLEEVSFGEIVNRYCGPHHIEDLKRFVRRIKRRLCIAIID